MRLTIDGLARAVGYVLREIRCQEQPSGRVRSLPNERMIRYYTTLGILDPPAPAGRSGLYGKRHVLQLVAIKRRQARGQALKVIQQHLVGIDDAELEREANLPLALLRCIEEAAPDDQERSGIGADEQSFWSDGTGAGFPLPNRKRLGRSIRFTLNWPPGQRSC